MLGRLHVGYNVGKFGGFPSITSVKFTDGVVMGNKRAGHTPPFRVLAVREWCRHPFNVVAARESEDPFNYAVGGVISGSVACRHSPAIMYQI